MTKKSSNLFMNFVNSVEKSWGFQTDLKWNMIFLVMGYHIFALYWISLYAFPVKWQTVVFALMITMLTGKAITCGAHRLWTHRTYKVKLPLNIYLMLCYTTGGQNSIYYWVRNHRVHHKYTDTDADPYNINRGFFFSHIGWLMMKRKNEVIEKCRQIDMSDIEADPVLMFEHRYSVYLGIIFGHILPILSCMYLCNEEWKCAVAWMNFIRLLFFYHIEFSVNSFAHTFGYKPYNKDISSTENYIVNFFSQGEGAHNYHHMFPYDYKASEFPGLTLSTKFIRLLAMMGLAYDLKEPSKEVIEATIKRYGTE